MRRLLLVVTVIAGLVLLLRRTVMGRPTGPDTLVTPDGARDVVEAAIGRRAGILAETKYSYEAYLSRTREAVSRLGAPAAPAPATRGAA